MFDNRAKIEEIQAQMKPIEGSILSEDVRKRENMQEQINPLADFIYKNQALYVPTEKLLDNDILITNDEKNIKQAPQEQAFREALYKNLVSYNTMLVIGAGLNPDPLFSYMWGPNRWNLNHEGGKVGFKHLMQIQKWNLAYQQIILGQEVDILKEMLEISRSMGAPYDQYGKKVGETWGHVWNTNYKAGEDAGNISGYYNDARGRGEVFGVLNKIKSAKIVLLAPDNFLHVYSLEPNLNSYDLRNPRKDILGKAEDGYVYLYTRGAAVSGIQQIITGDGYDLESGSNDYGAGWRCREIISEDEQFAIGAILGDAFEDPNAVSSFGQIVIGVIPVVGQVADARDVAVGIHKIWSTGGKDGKLQTAMALIGFIPIIGDGIKSAWKAAKSEIKTAGREGFQTIAKLAVREGSERTGKTATEELGKRLLKDAKEVASALKINVEEVV